MRHQDIHKHFSAFKTVSASREFIEASKRMVFATEQEGRLFYFGKILKPAFWGSFVVLFLVIVGAYFVGMRSARISYASLSPDKLNKELEKLAISIELQEIAYRQDINRTVAAALREISNDTVRHLNRRVLQEEQSELKLQLSTSPEIDVLLDKVIF